MSNLESHPMTNAMSPHKIVRHPFGLPLGTVRGVLSLMICSFFWILLLAPADQQAKAVLAHFFLLGLVFMAFATSTDVREGEGKAVLPWLFRVIFVVVTAGVVFVAWTRDPALVQMRLTPNPDEVREWWIPFLAATGIGFSFGLLLRVIFGRENHIFQTLRAWFSVVGLLMLALEIPIMLASGSTDAGSLEFMHFWQSVELAIVAAYFGTRA